MESNKQVIPTNTAKGSLMLPPRQGDLASLDIKNEQELAVIDKVLKHFVGITKGGITSIGEGYVILMRCKDLGIPFSTGIEHIHVIEGKTGIDVHIVNALLSRAGVDHTWLRPYTPLYEYTDGSSSYVENRIPDGYVKCKNKEDAADKELAVYPVRWYVDLAGGIYKDYQLNSAGKGAFVIVPNAQTAKAHFDAKAPGVPVFRCPNQPVDFIAEIEFERMIMLGKVIKVKKAVYSYTMSEAAQAGLTTKGVWMKYPQDMLQHRALVRGARDFAPDVLNGMLSTEEINSIVTDSVPYTEYSEVVE